MGLTLDAIASEAHSSPFSVVALVLPVLYSNNWWTILQRCLWLHELIHMQIQWY